MFSLHPSPSGIRKGTLTPSSRHRPCPHRHHRHLPCRRLRLPLLPRLALVERGHRQLPSDHKGLSRGILDVFCSCSMVPSHAGIVADQFHSTPELNVGRNTKPVLAPAVIPLDGILLSAGASHGAAKKTLRQQLSQAMDSDHTDPTRGTQFEVSKSSGWTISFARGEDRTCRAA